MILREKLENFVHDLSFLFFLQESVVDEWGDENFELFLYSLDLENW